MHGVVDPRLPLLLQRQARLRIRGDGVPPAAVVGTEALELPAPVNVPLEELEADPALVAYLPLATEGPRLVDVVDGGELGPAHAVSCAAVPKRETAIARHLLVAVRRAAALGAVVATEDVLEPALLRDQSERLRRL